MGLEHPLECPKGGPEEQSAHKPPKKGEEKKGDKKKEEKKEDAKKEEKKEAPKEAAAVQTGFIDGYERMVEESESLS